MWPEKISFHFNTIPCKSCRNNQQDATVYYNLLFQCLPTAQRVSSDTPFIIRSSKTVIAAYGFTYVCGCPQMYVKPEAAITVFELLMMSGVSLETRWAVDKHWNNKFEYAKLHLIGYFCMIYTMMDGSTNNNFVHLLTILLHTPYIYFTKHTIKEDAIALSVVIRQWTRKPGDREFNSRKGKRISCFLKQHGLWGPSSLVFDGTRGAFYPVVRRPGSKLATRIHLLQRLRVELHLHSPTNPHCCQRDNFTCNKTAFKFTATSHVLQQWNLKITVKLRLFLNKHNDVMT